MMVQTSSKDIDFSVARPGTNVVLVAEGKEIHVNKEFLSGFSSYFNTLLQSPNLTESSSSRIEIKYSYDQLLKCIQIVHGTGPLPTGSSMLQGVVDLMSSADRFDLPVVRRFCELELMGRDRCKRLTVDAYLMASSYGLECAKEMLSRVIPTEDYKDWFDDGPWEPNTFAVTANLNLTAAQLHELVRKVVKGREAKER